MTHGSISPGADVHSHAPSSVLTDGSVRLAIFISSSKELLSVYRLSFHGLNFVAAVPVMLAQCNLTVDCA